MRRSIDSPGSKLLVLVLSLLTAGAHAAIPGSERAALLSLYAATHGNNWLNNSGWNASAGTECSWFGVTCDPTGSTVTAISLSGNALHGFVPSQIAALTNLQTFDVGNYNVSHFPNLLMGPLPPLQGLSKLQTLIANNMDLTGPLPALSGMSSLVTLDLHNNQIDGSIPDLTGLSSLTTLRLNDDRLSGAIPALAGLGSLQNLYLHDNSLSGSIPALTGLVSLSVVGLDFNELSGTLPDLTGLTALTSFGAGGNNLTGSLPSLAGLSNLQGFGVSNNDLTGAIPSLSGLSKLQRFAVDGNQLTGLLPDLSGPTNLQSIVVQFNRLSGSVPAPPSQLTASGSGLCPNAFTPAQDPPGAADSAWNAATGSTPWSANCTASLLPTRTHLVGDPNKVADVGHPLTLTANVYGNNPTGTVTFTGTTPFISGTATLCADVQLAQGVATCTTSAIPPSGSTTTVVAKYAGDAVNASSSDQIGVYGAYLIVVTSSANPAQANQPIDLVAHVDGGAADEQLTFYDGTTLYSDAQPLCSSVPTVTANGAQFAHCAVTFATPGDHLITVVPSTRSEWNAADPQIIVQRVTAAQSFDADQFALTGTYASPGAKGQGLLLEVYTDHKAPGQGSVGGGWFAFDTAGNPQWYTLQGDMDQAHGSTFPVNLYQTTGGAFNAPPSVAASQVGTGELTFFDCAHAALSYSFADGRTGTLPYTRLSSSSNCSAAVLAVSQSPLPANYNDALHSGAWYNPSESGQGVIVDVIPSQKLLFAAWYTYAPASEGLTGNSAQRWFTLQPSGYTPGTLVLNDVPIYSTTGGSFNSMLPVSVTQVGAANIAFTSCSSLSIVYLFTSGEFAGLSGSFATQTLSLPAQCQ